MGNHLLVRQYDAHVWVEAWLPGQGWIEFDPTAAVAPSRIEQGLEAALSGSGESAFTGLGGALRNVPLLMRMQFLADYIEFGWAKWVLGYNQKNQLEFLSRWLGQVTPQRMVIALAAVGGSLLSIMLLWMLWRLRQPRLVWWQREYQQMHRLLNDHGVPVAAHMTAAEISRATVSRYPAAQQPLKDWLRCYDTVAYRRNGMIDSVTLQRQLRTLRQQVRRRLRHRG
jgi:hypothetical protein